MNVAPVLIDSRPEYCAHERSSVLRLPLGAGTLFTYLHEQIAAAGSQAVSVLTLFPPDDDYRAALRSQVPELGGVWAASNPAGFLDRFEPSDMLLLVDPVQFPAAGFRPGEVLRAARGPHVVTHLVATERSSQAAQERVLLDADGCVRRIQRYYAGVTWVNRCAVVCSYLPAAAARLIAAQPFSALTDLRRRLATLGVASRDIVLASGTIDLGSEEGLLHLVERTVLGLSAEGERRRGLARGAWRARRPGAAVHPTARLYGPVVLQDNVTLEANAAVIGPALLGAGCRIGANVILAQCVVCPDARVAAGTVERHRLILPDGRAPKAEEPATSAVRGPEFGLHMAAARISGRERRRAVYLHVKQVLDVVLASAGLLLLAPLMLIVAALIKLTSAGPVLFGHPRESVDGREFRCWKFRTMVADAHAQQRRLYRENQVDGPQFKLKHDPRITPLGRWLRATNLDELPQLLNVVLGQMSLIGPRPSPFRENQICVPWRQARLSVRPGITGLWQICRSQRSAGDFHQWIYYDILYVRHLSLVLDLKILLATIGTLGGRWSLPLEWLIPAVLRESTSGSALPTEVPILAAAPATLTTSEVLCSAR